MATEQILPPVMENQWRGMSTNEDVSIPTGFVSLAENFYLDGTVYKMRPGLDLAGSGALAAAKATVVHFQELDGTLWTVAFADADMWTYTWATDSWAQTDLATKSVTIDSSSVLDWCVSRGRLIITDGVNKPVMWNATTDTWTTLSNAPIAGGVTVYYDKVVFYDLPGSNAAVFEWSDEGDPTLGYSGDNQDWEFAQTDSGAITLMVGLNDVLPIWKQDSISKLAGSMEDTFQADAVREGISETEGAAGKFSAVVFDGDVFYLSQFGPRMLRRGVQKIDLDKDPDGNNLLQGTWSTFDPAEIQNAVAFLDKQRHHVVWLIPLAGETTRYKGIQYCIDNGSLNVFHIDTLSVDVVSACNAEDPDGNEWVLLGGADGKVYIYGGTSDDAGSNFTARLRSRQYGKSMGVVQKRLVQVDWALNILDANFQAKTRPFVGDGVASDYANYERPVRIPNVKDGVQYRRQFNITGHAVGWDFEATEQGGRCAVLGAVTQLTTTANTPTRV